MRFEGITIRNLGPFKDVSLDLAAISGTLVAVTGVNGAGKSTFLELLPGAIFRQCPTRGSLTNLATARDSFVEVRAVNGAAYTIRQSTDAISRKGEALILDSHQEPLVRSKVAAADAWVASHFPSAEVLYSSSFLAQSSAGFVDLPISERKTVLLRLLQIDRLERMATLARERARQCATLFATATARLADAQRRYPDYDLTLVEHEQAERTVAEREAELTQARERLALVLAECDVERLKDIAAQRERLLARLQDAQTQRAELNTRLTNNRMLLGQEQAIRSAAATHEKLTEQYPLLVKEQAETAAEALAASRSLAVQQREQTAASARYAKAVKRLDESVKLLADEPEVKKAAARLTLQRKKFAELKVELKQAIVELEALEAEQLTHKDKRVGTLRVGLKAVVKASTLPVAVDAAKDTLASDSKLEAAEKTAPARCEEKSRQVDKLQAARDKLAEAIEETAELAARMPELARAREAFVATKQEALEAKAQDEAAKGEAATQAKAAKHHAARNTTLTQRLAHTKEQLAIAATRAKQLPKLDAAKERIEELTPQLDRLLAQEQLDQAELAALPAPSTPALSPEAAQLAVASAQANEQRARAVLGGCVERLAVAAAGISDCERIRLEAAEHESELADWTRLGQDLGKDGLQALEIDAAIPELNTLTNDLLHSCHSARFTVEMRTDRLSSDGKRQLEDLEIRVIDTEHGRDAPIETYSGGERVIVGEAISLALTMLACRRAGLERPTLVRDESAAALDPANGRAYIAMLRRAADLLDCDKIFFVTHSPVLRSLADAHIAIADGGAAVAYPPFVLSPVA